MHIRVKVRTGERREKIIEKKGGVFEIFIKEKSERGMANERVRALAAEYFKISVQGVWIMSGHHHPNKHLSFLSHE